MTFISKCPDRVDQGSGLTKYSRAKFSLSKRGQGEKDLCRQQANTRDLLLGPQRSWFAAMIFFFFSDLDHAENSGLDFWSGVFLGWLV